MDKSVIIIGAGFGGLAAGCYGQMNGYRTSVFEMHDKPGGLCTSWQRKGYTIDGCLHWLAGSAPGGTPMSGMHSLWQELGALQGQQVIDLDCFYRVEGIDGRVFNIYSDIDRLEQHMNELAPEDARLISELCRALRRFCVLDLPVDKPAEMYTPFEGLRFMFKIFPFLGDLRKWSGMTMNDFAMQFKSPLMRDAWQQVWPSTSAMFILITLSMLHQRAAGYVIGGSMKLSRTIEKRYLDLGGEIRYKSPVTKILVENDCAVGVKLADGSEHRADYVISAADGHATIFDMLGGKYINEKIRGYYEKLPILPPLIYIGLGVNRSFKELPPTVSGFAFHLDKSVVIAGEDRKWLSARIHSFDPTLAPEGKSLLTVLIDSNYAYWDSLRQNMERYIAEKEQIADIVVALLNKRFPGLSSQVEMRDVATPVTFHRYTGNWQGAYEGWIMTPATVNLRMKKTLPGLDRFYMAGQWVQPGGGLPSGAMTGGHVIQMMCKRDRKRFVTTVP